MEYFKKFERMGAEAFLRGLKCAPFADERLIAGFEGRLPGDGRSKAEMQAWLRGWTYESLKFDHGCRSQV